MRSSQVAAQSGVGVQTLRYYERRGLLPKPRRSLAGYRSYDGEAVRLVRFVRHAQKLGFSLDEIGSLLSLAAGGPDSCTAARALAKEKAAELQEKIASLTAMRDSLEALILTCARRRDRRVCPLLDAIDNQAEVPLP
jgi:DNA-binding transcriptional MerR regulator